MTENITLIILINIFLSFQNIKNLSEIQSFDISISEKLEREKKQKTAFNFYYYFKINNYKQ